jgi:hypothetical protein
MGLFQVYAGLSSKLLREALFFMLISMAGITLGRLCGLLAFETGEYIASSLLYDIPVVMLTAIAYRNLFWLTHAQNSPA